MSQKSKLSGTVHVRYEVLVYVVFGRLIRNSLVMRVTT